MTDRTTIFSKRYGEDLFEVVAISFDGVRERGGFRRAVRTTRHSYLRNGEVTPKLFWLTLLGWAKADHKSEDV